MTRTLLDAGILALMPFFTALIGWLTNWVAIRMMFRPRNPVNILGFQWQGLIPRRQAEVAKDAGRILQREVREHHLLENELRRINLDPIAEELLRNLIQKRLGTRLQTLPFIGNFINDATVAKLHEIAREELRKEMPAFIHRLAEEAENHLEIDRIVEEHVSRFDLDKLERIVYEAAGREFRTIEILGGVLGFVVGLLQILILILTGMLRP